MEVAVLTLSILIGMIAAGAGTGMSYAFVLFSIYYFLISLHNADMAHNSYEFWSTIWSTLTNAFFGYFGGKIVDNSGAGMLGRMGLAILVVLVVWIAARSLGGSMTCGLFARGSPECIASHASLFWPMIQG